MTVNGYNLIILLGAGHGLLLSLLLVFSRRNSRLGNVLLALVLVFYTLPVLRVVLLDMDVFHSYQLWFLSLELLYGLGPSLYLYAKTVSEPNYVLRKTDFIHFVPVILEIVYYFSPVYRQLGQYTLTAPQDIYHLIWIIEQVGSIVSIMVYLVLTNIILWKYGRWLRGNYSDTAKRALTWLRRPVILYSTFFALWFGTRAVDVFRFDDSMSIEPYYPLLILLSFSTYWIGTRGYFEIQIDVDGFGQSERKINIDPSDDVLLVPVYRELTRVMVQEKPFLDDDLSLSQLASQLKVNPRLLSRAINIKAGKNFYDFINQFRIDEFKRLVTTADKSKSLIDLAHDCGFGSKATFNNAFKRFTGMTPSEFRKRQQPS